MIDPRIIRLVSLETVRKLGLQTNAALPLLEENLSLRPVDETISRALAISGILAAAYGYSKPDVINWLKQENLLNSLTKREMQFLEVRITARATEFQFLVEAVNALAWTLGFVEELDFTNYCKDDLIEHFPDIRQSESRSLFRKEACYRSLEEIAQACDISYLLHWEIVHSNLHGKATSQEVRSYVITQRRHALEWVLSSEDWSDICLDT